MAKNKNNFKNNTSGSSRNVSTDNKTSNATSKGGSMKDTHSQTPDSGASRSGPGGE